MSQPPASFDLPAEEYSPVRWAFHVWSWIALLALFLILEAWVDPLTASLVLCLKLGWRDLLVAMRLRSTYQAGLGSAIGMYCLAQACFKVALAGVVVGIVVIGYEALLGVPQPMERFLAGLILLFLGLFVGSGMVLFAATRSCQGGVRGWLDGTIYEHLLKRDAPLRCHGAFNRVPWLLRAGMLLLTVLLATGPVTAIAVLVLKGNFAGVPGGLMFAMLWWWSIRPLWAAHATAALSPEECWGPG
jgi:hypothetical protein